MASNMKTLLKTFLGQLKLDELNDFIWNLTNPDEDGISEIPPGDLPQNSKKQDVVDKIVETHEDNGIIVTCKILRMMQKNQLATKLEVKALGLATATASGAASGGASGAASGAASGGASGAASGAASGGASGAASGGPSDADIMEGSNFVDQHRRALIQRVSAVEAILDELLGEGVITQEDYSKVKSKGINQEKMRELYDGPLNACGKNGKYIFYKILLKKHAYLMDDLKTLNS